MSGFVANQGPDEQHPFLEGELLAAPAPRRRGLRLLGVAAVLAVAGTAAYQQAPSSSARTTAWRVASHAVFLAATEGSAGVDSIKEDAAAVKLQAKHGKLASHYTLETATAEMSLAKKVEDQETREVTRAGELRDTAQAMASEAKTAEESSITIGQMATQDSAAAQAVEKQAVADLTGAEQIMKDAQGSAAKDIVKMAEEQKKEAESAKTKADKEMESAKDMEEKAAKLKAEAEEKAQAAGILNNTAADTLAAAQPILEEAKSTIEHADSLQKASKDMLNDVSKSEDSYSKLHDAADSHTAELQKAAADEAEAKTDIKKAVADEKKANSTIAEANDEMKMSGKETALAMEIKEQLAAQTKLIDGAAKTGETLEDQPVFTQIETAQDAAQKQAETAADQETAKAAELAAQAKALKADAEKDLSAAAAEEAAAKKKKEDAKTLINNTNSGAFTSVYMRDEAEALQKAGEQDAAISKTIADTKASDAKLLDAVKNQGVNQHAVEEDLAKQAVSVDKVANNSESGANAVKDAAQNEAKMGEDKLKLVSSADVDVAKMGTYAAKLTKKSEDELAKAAELSKALGVEATAAPTAAPTGCCSYADVLLEAAACGKADGYCDSGADACTKCKGTSYLDPKPVA